MPIADGNNASTEMPVPSNPNVLTLEEPKDTEAAKNENQQLNALVAYVKGKMKRSEDQRRWDEQRWLLAYHNYRGLYGPDVQFTDEEKSQAFMKITKTKVLAAYNKIVQVLFANNQFPIGVEPTNNPQGIKDAVHFDPKAPEMPDDQDEDEGLPGTFTRQDIFDEVGPLKKNLKPVSDKLEDGPGLTPTSYTWEPARIAAELMTKAIQDQLEESNADKAIRRFVFDCSLFGTGIFKGPFILNKEYAHWTEDGTYAPIERLIPDVSHVSIWDMYPDPDARNMEECEFVIQRHKMSRSELRKLTSRPGFRKESIEAAIADGTHYMFKYWENDLKDNLIVDQVDRYEVLEYWGLLDKQIAEEHGIDIPEAFKDRNEVQVNIWIANNQILRLVLNQFTPARIPYYACPFELNPYSFFGVGIAENMEDTQLIMNGFMRLAIDNAALSSNIIFELDETLLSPGQDMKLYPGKIFRRQGGQPGQTLFATKFPNVTQECMLLFDKARQLADEATGMPSYAHGISGIQSTGRTASGMSMLMGAADENIKGVLRNVDDYLLVPLGRALFAFNMQFNFDKKFIGDVEVVARGTEALLRNEVRGQKLLQFMQIASNPMDAPFIKRDYLLRELAKTLDLDPDKMVNDPREAGVQAFIMGQMNQAQGIQPQGQGGQGGSNAAGAPSPSDPTGTGGGNIAPGNAPAPQTTGNTGSGGGSSNAAAANGGSIKQ